MVSKSPRNLLSDSARNYVAKTILTYTQTLGLADRNELEGLIEQVISKLEKDMSLEERTKVKRIEPTFPGMEHLVAHVAPAVPAKEQIESIVTEILAEKTSTKAQAETAVAPGTSRARKDRNCGLRATATTFRPSATFSTPIKRKCCSTYIC